MPRRTPPTRPGAAIATIAQMATVATMATIATLALTSLVALALAATAAPLPAQVVAAGERVRVVPHGGTGRYVAHVVRVRDDTLWLVRGAVGGLPDTTVALPLVDVRRLERSTGQQRHLKRNAWYGALAGAALGAVTGLAAGAEDDVAGEAAIGLATLAALPGAVVGAVTGTRRTEHWQYVPLTRPAVWRDSLPGWLRGVKPRLSPARVPRGDGTWARAATVGVRVIDPRVTP